MRTYGEEEHWQTGRGPEHDNVCTLHGEKQAPLIIRQPNKTHVPEILKDNLKWSDKNKEAIIHIRDYVVSCFLFTRLLRETLNKYK